MHVQCQIEYVSKNKGHVCESIEVWTETFIYELIVLYIF